MASNNNEQLYPFVFPSYIRKVGNSFYILIKSEVIQALGLKEEDIIVVQLIERVGDAKEKAEKRVGSNV